MHFDSFCVVYKLKSIGSKRWLGTNVSKEAIFLVTKVLSYIFVISCVRNLREQYTRVEKVFDKYCRSNKIIL